MIQHGPYQTEQKSYNQQSTSVILCLENRPERAACVLAVPCGHDTVSDLQPK